MATEHEEESLFVISEASQPIAAQAALVVKLVMSSRVEGCVCVRVHVSVCACVCVCEWKWEVAYLLSSNT